MERHLRRIAFWGNFGSGNLGNECTLQALAHHARRRLPAAELCCVCSVPEDVEQRHGLAALPISPTRFRHEARTGHGLVDRIRRVARRLVVELRDWPRVFGMLGHIDALMMTGTGMLADSGEGPLGLPYEIFKWSLMTRARRRRLLFVSVGVESIRHPLARFFIKTALRLADYRSYRDTDSRDNLRRLGLSAAHDAVYPDLAFSLPEPTPTAAAGGVLHPLVVVGLYDFLGRGASGDDDAAAYRAYVEKVCAFVVWLREQGYRVRLILGDLRYDLAVLADVRLALAARGFHPSEALLVSEPATTVEQLLEHLAAADLVVATRFHNVLLGLLLGKPAVSISYHRKNDALMAEMGLGRYCQSVAQLDVELLQVQFRDLEAHAAQLRPAILAMGRVYRTQLEEQFERIFA